MLIKCLLIALSLGTSDISVAPVPLTLERALELAQSRHQTPAIADAQVERARATRRLAASALLPDVTLSGTYARQPERSLDFGNGQSQVIQDPHVRSARAQLQMTIFEIRNFLVLRRAGPEFEAVEKRAEHLARQLQFETARAFIAVLSAEQLQQASARRVTVAEKASHDAKSRFNHGLAGKNDVTRAELELLTSELMANDSEAFIHELRLQLERYVGEAAHGPLVTPMELLETQATDNERLLASAHDERPDLLALKAAAKAARLAAYEPLWNLAPKVGLNGAYDLTTQKGLMGRHDNWMVSLTATWNVFNQGREYFEHQEKSAAATEAELNYQKALDDATIEIKRAFAQCDRIRAAMSRAKARADLAKQNAEEVAIRYREGVANAFELASASSEEFNANAELARAQFDLGTSLLAVRQAMGSTAFISATQKN